ncbi:MAG: T9SS type A sorting domain-containing protein [Candidatus Cloacimonetes bacterium]|nr:T9SS type A sorting domain-containing protein [Candidatus Cloacimonadota bacterium]
MKNLLTLSAVGLLLAATTTLAGRPPVSPEVELSGVIQKNLVVPQVQDFVNTGAVAAALLGADYLVAMQADVTEDNAGNGFDGSETPEDPDDGGWDWVTNGTSHTAAASPLNIYGATIQGLYNAYQLDPKPEYLTAMTDAADAMVAAGNSSINRSSDVLFLLKFAVLTGNSSYASAAKGKLDYRFAEYTDAAGLAEYIRVSRGSGTWHNGIIPWDIGAYVLAAQAMHALHPGDGYDADADAMAEVLYQDSFVNPAGYYKPFDAQNDGYDAGYGNSAYWVYTLGLSGLIESFCTANVHMAEVPALKNALLGCQTPSGAFSYQNGGNAGDEDWQCTAYAVRALSTCFSGVQTEIASAAAWLASTQDASGAFIYTGGDHYPEEGGECTAALALAAGYSLSQTASDLVIGEDAGTCPELTTLTYHIDGAADYRSCTVFIGYDPLVLEVYSVDQIYDPGSNTFASFDNGAGSLEVTFSMLGVSPGTTSGSADLFSVTFDAVANAAANNTTNIAVTNVVMRDKFNGSIPIDDSGDTSVTVDGEIPTLSASLPGTPCAGDYVYNADFIVPFSGTDNIALDHVEYNFDDGPWVSPTMTLGTFTTDMFAPGDYDLADGGHVLNVRYLDSVCYASLPVSLAFILDTTAPVAASNLVATPNTHAVDLTWTAGSGHDGYVLNRYKRVGYPYFWDGFVGLPPAGSHVAAGSVNIAAGATSYTDDFGSEDYTTRAVYDYELVAVDCVNPNATSNMASATNYFLGDWFHEISPTPTNYDGFVCTPDLTLLSGYYGLDPDQGATAGFEDGDTDEMDVAPTSDMGPFGLPGPDGRINFEDLIILAINYRLGCSTPLASFPTNPHGKDMLIAEASGLELQLTESGAALLLDGEAMGYSARLRTERQLLNASLPAGTVMHYSENGELVIDAVGLGSLLDATTVLNLEFAGSGAIELVSVDARDQFNAPLSLTVDVPPALLPVAYELQPNFPNPFNPTTTLRFALPVAGEVRLAVYNMLGQQVALLVNGSLDAGWHSLVFDASALSSGLYYSRLEANGFTAMQKMLLVK